MELVGPVRVGELEVDVEHGRVTCRGEPVGLPRLSVQLLVELVRAHPGVARSEDLVESLWPQGFMTESNLKQRVYLLRQALDDGADEPRYVRTVRGWGYQLAVAPASIPGGRALVAVADVMGSEGDAEVSMALTAAVRHGLEHRADVSVAPSGRLVDALRLLRHDPDERMTVDLALRGARRDGGLDFVVAGSLWRLENGRVTLELSVLDVLDGTPTDRARVEAPTPGDLLGRLDAAIGGLRIRAMSGPTRREPDARRPVVTTSSVPALCCYERASSALDTLAMGRAQPFLEEAVLHDPEFATAWVDLAWTRIWNEDLRGAREAADRAGELVDALTESERHHVLALTSSLAGDLAGALNQYEVALTFQPNHYWARVNLAGCQLLADRTDAALESYRHAVELRPNAAASHWNLGVAEFTARGNLDAAGGHLAVVRDMSAEFPFPLPWLIDGLRAWEVLDLDAASACFAEMLATRLPAAPPLGQHMGLLLHARLLATRGRWQQAAEELTRARAVVDEHGGWAQYTDLELALTLHEAGERSTAEDLLEDLRRIGSSLYRAQATGWLAVLAARAGEQSPEPLLDELAAMHHDDVWEFGYPTLPAFTRAQRCFPALARGELALQAGEPREAHRWFREVLAAAPRHVDGPVPVVALGPAPHVAALEGAAHASVGDDPSLSRTGFAWIAEHPVTVLMTTPAGAGPWSRAQAALDRST